MRTPYSGAIVVALFLAGTSTAQDVAGKATVPAAGAPAPLADATDSQPSAAASEAPVPFGGPLFERTKLTGDWGGLRSDLRDNGITFDVSANQYYQGIGSGGLDRNFIYGGRADYLMKIDGEKAGLWKGSFLDLHGESVYGSSVNSNTGAILPVNFGRSLPSPNTSVTALTGVKFTQALSENFAVFAGKINTFDSLKQPFLPGTGVDPGTGFMNFGQIFSPVVARTMPYSTWGAGGSIIVDGQPAATLMALDTHNTPTTTGFESFFTNGVTLLGMAGLPSNFFGMTGVHMFGGSYSSGNYADTDSEAFSLVGILVRSQLGLPLVNRVNGSWNIFYQGQQTLWTDPCDSKRSWGAFWNAGLSDGIANPVRWSGNAGIAGASPIAGRNLDTFGASYYYMGLSDSFKNFAPRLLPLRDEQGIELFYTAAVTPWCRITPDFQVVIPARSNVDTTFVFGLRARIDF